MLKTQPIGNTSYPVNISERLVMNYHIAKQLWHTLRVALQRHEQAFGVLETDISKRVIPQSWTQQSRDSIDAATVKKRAEL